MDGFAFRLVIVGGPHGGEKPIVYRTLDAALDAAQRTFDGLAVRPPHACDAVRVIDVWTRQVAATVTRQPEEVPFGG